ncbi:MAG: pyruvate phosphate dikinase [Deltaproteobacteria bacterium SG8_13]|nr:MAG: pyruvate phosphate dikinase [Deltaproteobacteria bacterium SG8_13]
MKSKALEVNLADYHVDVAVDEKYLILQDIMSRYYGLMDGFNTFLKELSHPYRNWSFIVAEARRYGLEYFHLLDNHPNGPQGARLFVDIFFEAIDSGRNLEVRAEAVDNLLLFLQKTIRDSKSGIDRFMPALNQAFDRIGGYEGETFFLFVKSFYQLNKLGEYTQARVAEISGGCEAINSLMLKYFRTAYAYWLCNKDPVQWFTEEAGLSLSEDHKARVSPLFEEISHQQINTLDRKLSRLADSGDLSSSTILTDCLKLVGYGRIVEAYRRLPLELFTAGGKTGRGNEWKVVFLFHMMSLSGLSMIHEEVLRDINRTVSWLIEHETRMNIRKLLQKTFAILATQTVSYPATALNCVLNMGRGVFKTDQGDLIHYFVDQVVEMGFQAPRISGVGSDWQIKANSAHIQNIRSWLELIELNPKWSTRLISVLIIHLALSGVFIKDTDLFPRDITRVLNSDIGPVYNLIKQLTRLFPVFFNDIGAEGQLRDISTQVDEITHRKDRLIHFVRKQSHVESSNKIIDLLDAVWGFWATGNKDGLEEYVPPDVFEQVNTQGIYIDGVNRVVAHLGREGIQVPEGLIRIDRDELRKKVDRAPGVEKIDKERVCLLAGFYKLLQQKYNFESVELNTYISQLSTEAIPDLNRLKTSLEEPDLKKKLFKLLDYLKQLKSIILSAERYEVREDIYKKRHITIDIPSMYGSYHEMKFDALGLTFRIESLVNVLFEELIEGMDLSLITKATFYSIYARIRLFDKALRLEGISSVEIERQLDLLAHSLEIKGFSFTQYLDIFKGFAAAVKNIINDYFHNVHEPNLARILESLPVDRISAKYLPKGGDEPVGSEKLVHRVSEIFFRDRIALSLGLQQLDRFLSRILHILYQQADKLPKDKLHQLLIYDPENALTSIQQPNNRVTDLIYLGNKGLNLLYLQNLGLPVPPGFIITTEVFRCREMMESYQPAEENFKERIARQIGALEQHTGKSFGSPSNPLLLSVRSGSSISQPGMMDTFLNVGMNAEIVSGLADRSGNEWFAWDNYRRFLQCYGMVFGLERDEFDAIISELKRRVGVAYKREFTGPQMKKVALTYKHLIQDSGIHIFEDPYEQLYQTIKAVFDSWESDKARTYRKIMGISDDWGTAATVQSMVFGNLSESSGTGVVFTHSPRQPGGTLHLWGDFTLGNQGEDVVAGLVITLPISINQQDIEMRQTDVTLESHFPDIYNALKQWSSYLIYEKGWTPQEMEFTFESPSLEDLHILQCRDMAMRERKKVPRFDLTDPVEERYLGHGIGIGGGAMTGRVVFSLEEIDRWRSREPHTSLILVRSDTVPDDIREIYAADGLLTARGGVTSHASVVAHRLGKTCVVGCGDMICDEKARNCKLKGIVVKSGEFISIDGQEGSVYSGKLHINRV